MSRNLNTNWKLIQEILSIDAVFFNYDEPVIDPTIFYATGYKGYGTLLIPKKGKPLLIVPEMDIERAKKTGLPVRRPEKTLENEIHSLIKQKPVGLNYDAISLAFFRKIKKYLKKTEDVSRIVKNIRKIKTSDECSKIAKACKITEDIMASTINNLASFKREEECAAYAHKLALDKGAELAFPVIVASGKSSAIPHHEPGGKMRKGFCIIDLGVKWKGYCSDMTRTVFIGNPNKKEIESYNLVESAQKEAIRYAHPGVPIKNLTFAVNRIFGEEKKRFIHSLGHGVGLNIHEAPLLGDNDEKLAEGMVVTIEPGLYYSNKYGVRIEDTIAVLQKGPRNLMRLPTDFRAINP